MSRNLVLAGVAVISITAITWTARSIWSGDIGAGINRMAVSTSAAVGLRVENVLLEGRRNAPRLKIRDAVSIGRGDPLLAVDLNDTRKRLEAISWIKEATVRRHWPDTIQVIVRERKPIARWQRKKRLSLIDGDGITITRNGLNRFRDLLLVVGKDAPKHAAHLITTLKSQPSLRHRVVAAIRVGDRRWDLRFKNGVEVRLPEKGVSLAWARLARIEQQHGLIKTGVRLIDMRLPDRLIVRAKTGPARSLIVGERRT